MNHELIFSLAGILAVAGWVSLLLSPLMPIWSERIAGLAIPVVLSAGYGIMAFAFLPPTGGFGSFAEVTELFSHADALIAGWIHYLAFDLLVGAWICRQGQRDDMAFWLVAPCLPVTFLFGPAGYLMFQIVRCVRRAAVGFVPLSRPWTLVRSSFVRPIAAVDPLVKMLRCGPSNLPFAGCVRY